MLQGRAGLNNQRQPSARSHDPRTVSYKVYYQMLVYCPRVLDYMSLASSTFLGEIHPIQRTTTGCGNEFIQEIVDTYAVDQIASC